MKLPRSPKTSLYGVKPLSAKERAAEYLEQERERQEWLLVRILDECRSDTQFLDRVLKKLRPLSKRGRRTEKWNKARHVQLLVEMASLEPRTKDELEEARVSVARLHGVSVETIVKQVRKARKVVQKSDLPVDHRWILRPKAKPPRK